MSENVCLTIHNRIQKKVKSVKRIMEDEIMLTIKSRCKNQWKKNDSNGT